MKRLIVLSLMVAASSQLMAKDYGAAGCGAGSILFEGQTGLGPHILAATTNGLYGTQTFAMSSGTLGCDVNGTINSHTAANYINGNMDNIAFAIAEGKGEALRALADAFKIDAQDHDVFARELNANFNSIYVDQSTSAADVYASIVNIMRGNETLSKYTA